MRVSGSLVVKNSAFGMVYGGGADVSENVPAVAEAVDNVPHADAGDAGKTLEIDLADVASAADAVALVLVLVSTREAECYSDDNLVIICLAAKELDVPRDAIFAHLQADTLDKADCCTQNAHPHKNLLANDGMVTGPLADGNYHDKAYQHDEDFVPGNHPDNKALEGDQKN